MKNKTHLLLAFALFLFGAPLFADGELSINKEKAYFNNESNEPLLKQISRGFSRVAKKATPAVVYIESDVSKEEKIQKQAKKGSHENPFDYFHDEFFNRFFGFPLPDEKPKTKSHIVRGSGFLVTSDGLIVTNNHVVENAKTINVTLNNGKQVPAKVIGTDSKTDLAVIKIEGKNYPYLSFGNSDDLEVGDWVIAVGNPFGLQATVTVGVVSAKGRSQLHITDFEDFIQTDAAINPGNSGGPLLNVDGEVIGINTAIVSGSGGYMGIGFAIPSNMASSIIEQLIKTGAVTRGFLGVTLQPIDEDLAKFYQLPKVEGALITDVVKGSPADVGGLKQEDVILSYNNISVENNLSGFRNTVALMHPGSKLALKVMRDGKVKDIVVTISSSPDNVTIPATPTAKLGMQIENLTPEKAEQLGYDLKAGVLIVEVQQDSVAYNSGVRPGDLIMAVNRNKVKNLEEFNKALHDAVNEGKVLLMIRHKDTIRFLVLQVD